MRSPLLWKVHQPDDPQGVLEDFIAMLSRPHLKLPKVLVMPEIRLDGAVETAIRLGVADVVADVVETGSTLRQAGLEVFGEPILQSEAVLIRGSGNGSDAADVETPLDQLQRRQLPPHRHL